MNSFDPVPFLWPSSFIRALNQGKDREGSRRGGPAWPKLGLIRRGSQLKPEGEAGPGWVLLGEGPRTLSAEHTAPHVIVLAGRATLPRDRARGHPARPPARWGQRLGAAAAASGTLASSLSPRRENAPTRRQPRGPLGRPPRTHPDVKSCCTLSSRSRRVSSIASPPLRPRAAAAPRRRRAPPPARPPAGRLSPHTLRSGRAFRVPAPSARRRPAQPQCSAQQRVPPRLEGRAFAEALALSADWAGSRLDARLFVAGAGLSPLITLQRKCVSEG